MSRFGLFLFVTLLVSSSSGFLELLAVEPCSITESESSDSHGTCGAACVRCHCGRAFDLVGQLPVAERPPLRGDWLPVTSAVPASVPLDILHVPKLGLS